MRKRKPSKNTERKMPPLPADDPLFTQGWIVGQTFGGWSPAEARKLSFAKSVMRRKPKGSA